MQDAGSAWTPQLGDYVHVTVTGATGQVTEIVGAGADQRFIVAIWPPPDSPPSTAQAVAHRFCTLDDLAPARMC